MLIPKYTTVYTIILIAIGS